MPIDVVLKNSESNSNNDYVEIDYQGERVVVSQLENNQYVINRVI
ncbi:MAG: hypothetical protein N3B21_06025, partial [Clostridia bacterium]|nr:hypothetical protein [Clostridia bacterium]